MTIEELAERVDTPVRTIRFYIAEGMLAGSGARGRASYYGEEHLLRLMLIRRLVSQHVPLKDIRDRVARLSLDEVRALLAEDERREEALQQARVSPRDYVSSLLDRARTLRETPGLEAPVRQGPSQPAPTELAADKPASEPRGGGSGRQHLEGDADAIVVPPVFRKKTGLEEAEGAQAWQRWELAPGVELHVRADTAGRYRNLVERLLGLASAITGRRTK